MRVIAVNPPSTLASSVAVPAAGSTLTGGALAGDFLDWGGAGYNASAFQNTTKAVGDGQVVSDGAITSGLAVLTSASNKFAATDVGKTVVVAAAGAAGITLVTTILSFQSAGQVTLTASAGANVTGANVVWGTDNTAAIQALLDKVNNAAGTLRGALGILGPGYFLCAGNLDAHAYVGVRVTGNGAPSGGSSTGTVLAYSGITSPFINALGTAGTEFDHMVIAYLNNQFVGTLIDCQRSGGTDNTKTRIHDALIGGGVQTSAAILLSLSQVDYARIENVAFGGAAIAIQGVDTTVVTKFSNVVQIVNCQFSSGGASYQLTTIGIRNPGLAWLIEGCNFEPLASGAPGAIDNTAACTVGDGITIKSCWFGDAAAAGTWINFLGAMNALNIEGNRFAGRLADTVCIATAGGTYGPIRIVGNAFNSALTALALGAAVFDLDFTCNNFNSVTNFLTGPTNILSGRVDNATKGTQFYGGRMVSIAQAAIAMDGGGTRRFDASLGELFICNLTATTTMGTPLNLATGAVFTAKIIHDATATAFTLTWPATFKFAGGTFGTNKAGTNTANAVDQVTFVYDGTNFNELNRAMNLS